MTVNETIEKSNQVKLPSENFFGFAERYQTATYR